MKLISRIAFIVALCAFILLAGYRFRNPILAAAGQFLDRTDSPFRADVVVVVRGDEVYYNRALRAAGLFDQGLAPQIYVSSALDDLAAYSLRGRGIVLNKAQDNIAAVLIQSHVPCGQILLDQSQPGGGTLGEINRLKEVMTTRGYSTALLVTSWYHSRRLRALIKRSFADSGKSFAIIASNELTNSTNWWLRRYVAIAVLEEYVKLFLEWLPFQLRFDDDPSQPKNAVVTACDAAPGAHP